jgi:protein-tyrosine kinase
MEKIHSAIQKARKERDAKLSRDLAVRSVAQHGDVAPPAAALPPEQPVPVAQAQEPLARLVDVAAPGVIRRAAWDQLVAFKPDHSVLKRSRILAFENSPEAAGYDVLRTNVLRQMRANGWKRVAITSPAPGCGKTTTALNLGFSLGRLHDLRTLVLEVDFRRPSMRNILKLRQKHMFAAYLSGQAEAVDSLVSVGTGLAIGTNSGPSRNSAELLASDATTERLNNLDQLFAADLTVFDLPPMLVSDDTISFLPRVDCTLLIAAAGVTTTAQIDRCERTLSEQTNVLGVVLNKCEFMGKDDYYGYDYY